MKTYIICNGKTGFTQQYADWIAEETGGTVLPYKGFTKTAIDINDIVIYGSRVHIGKIEHLDKVKGAFQNHRNFAVFATGGMPAAAGEAVEKFWAENLTREELGKIPHFYMPGGINYEKMGAVERTLMKTFAKMMAGQKDKSDADAAFAARLQSSYDISSKEYIGPLVEAVQEMAFRGRQMPE